VRESTKRSFKGKSEALSTLVAGKVTTDSEGMGAVLEVKTEFRLVGGGQGLTWRKNSRRSRGNGPSQGRRDRKIHYIDLAETYAKKVRRKKGTFSMEENVLEPRNSHYLGKEKVRINRTWRCADRFSCQAEARSLGRRKKGKRRSS